MKMVCPFNALRDVEVKKMDGTTERFEAVERIEVSEGFVFIYVGEGGTFSKMVRAVDELEVKLDA